MRPAPMEYERVPTDDFVLGIIQDVEYEQDHTFTFKGAETVSPAVRLVLKIAEMKHLKKTRWMKFFYGEKSNVYLKFLVPLVEGAKPNMEFDMDQLKGLKIKMLWKDDNNPKYQSIETIRPIGAKVIPEPLLKGEAEPLADVVEVDDGENVPF